MRIFSKRMLVSIFILTVIFCIIQKDTYGQLQEVIIGKIDRTDKVPIGTGSNYSRSYSLYNSTDIGISGLLTTVAFKVTKYKTGTDISNIKVYLLNIDDYIEEKKFLEEYENWDIGEFSKVFEGKVEFRLIDGWIHIDLQTPFNYDGRSLVIGVEYDKSEGQDNVLEWGISTKGYSKFNASDEQLESNLNDFTGRLLSKLIFKGNVTNSQLQEVIIGKFDHSDKAPIVTEVNYSRSYSLYNSSEIGISGLLTTVAFEVNKSETGTDISNLKVYLLNIENYNDEGKFREDYENWDIGKFSKVFDGKVEFRLIDGWIHIDLQTPFNYKGASLVLGVEYEKTEGNNNTIDWGISTKGYSKFNASDKQLENVLNDFTGRLLTKLIFNSNVPNGQLQEVTIGKFDHENSDAPIGTGSNYSRSYSLYNNSDIATSGLITSIAFNVVNYENELDISRLKVYMLNSDKYNNLEKYPTKWDVTEFSKLFEGRVDFELSDGWIYIDLEEPFYYDGTSLIVGIEYKKNFGSESLVKWGMSTIKGSYCMNGISAKEFPIELEQCTGRPLIKLIFNGAYPNPGMDIKTSCEAALGGLGSIIQGEGDDFGFEWSASNDFDGQFPNNKILNPIVNPREITTYTLAINNKDGFITRRDVVVEPKVYEYYGYEDTKYVVDGGIFLSSNGDGKDYNYNEDYIATFYPCNPKDKLIFYFKYLDVIEGDYLDVYLGEKIDDNNLLGRFDNKKPIDKIECDFGGAITFVFHSDEMNVGKGWYADIKSVNVCDQLSKTAKLSIEGGSCDNRTININVDLSKVIGASFQGWYESVDNKDYTFLEGGQSNTLTVISKAKYYKAKVIIIDKNNNETICYSNVLKYSDVCHPVSTTILLEKDATIFSLSTLMNINLGSYPVIRSSTWTNGSVYSSRGLLEFDLSTIPQGSIIQSAKLTLFGQNHQFNYLGAISNASYLKKLVEPWQEYAVTWNSKPESTISGQISIPETEVGTNENREIEIKDFVQDWVNGEENNGMVIRLVDEIRYSAMSFASSDNANISLHPKLDITYISLPSLIVNTTNLKKTDENGNVLKYTISGSGLSSSTVAVGSALRYNPFVPASGSSSQVSVKFMFDKRTDLSTVKLIIDKNSYITGVKASDGSNLSNSYYRIINNNTIVFLDGTSLYEEENILPVYVDLKDGVLMDLDDPQYNKFHVVGADACVSFSLNIYDKIGAKVFSTTNKLEQWDGITDNSEDDLFVFPGSYTYEIEIDGILVKGKFLIDYTIQENIK